MTADELRAFIDFLAEAIIDAEQNIEVAHRAGIDIANWRALLADLIAYKPTHDRR